MAVAHTIASALQVTHAALPRLAAVVMLLLKMWKQRLGVGRRAYYGVSAWGDVCSGAKARCSDDAVELTVAVSLRRWPSRIR